MAANLVKFWAGIKIDLNFSQILHQYDYVTGTHKAAFFIKATLKLLNIIMHTMYYIVY